MAGWSATCPVCGVTITGGDTVSGRNAFQAHVNSHPKCGRCGARFTSNLALGAHALTVHGVQTEE